MLFKLLILFIFPACLTASPFGKDADLVNIQCYPAVPRQKSGPGVFLSRALIKFHQTVVTPIDGPRSHFRPSSSQYTMDAIEKYGFLKGFIFGADRLMRENDDPWIYPKTLNEHGELYKWDPVR